MDVLVEFARLIAQVGPAAVFVGAGFEGHTAVIAGGVLAHQKLMSVWVSWACACAGSWAVDQTLFVLGRRGRESRFVQRSAAVPAFGKALRFIERYPVGYILAFRFLYGLRMVSPVAIGVSQLSARLFLILNLLGAALWAGVFTAVGYLFGHALGAWFGAHHLTERQLIWGGVILVGGLAAILVVRRAAGRRAR